MTADDEPTKPLPADLSGVPASAEAPTEPLIAPHVPVADVSTTELSALTQPVAPRGRLGAGVLAVVGGLAGAAVIGTVLLLTLTPRGGAPASDPSPSPSTTVTVDTADDSDGSDAPAPPPPPPPPAEPTPEPTTPSEPTPEPTTTETP